MMEGTAFSTLRWPTLLVATLGMLVQVSSAQSDSPSAALPRARYRSGEETLRAFASVSAATRHSIVRFNVDGQIVALGTIVSTNGMALTKASELKKGKLTCWLADDTEADAELISVNEEEDLALVRVRAEELVPIQWADGDVQIGQWAITPGIIETPHAVGIISALPRKIRRQRAFIGVQFESNNTTPRVQSLLSGFGAEKAGLKRGDIIVAVNSAAVTNRVQVVEMLSEFRDGQTVKLGIEREDEKFEVEVRMAAKGDDPFGQDFPRRRSNRLGGQVSQRAEDFEQAIEHDTVLQPWLCGGPLVNLDGKAIGINIARAGRVTTYALPAKLVQRILENLKRPPV